MEIVMEEARWIADKRGQQQRVLRARKGQRYGDSGRGFAPGCKSAVVVDEGIRL
jgi:hypothetical protein